MRRVVSLAAGILASLYIVAILAWFGLRAVFGDSIGLLALTNALALYLFVPLVLFLVLMVWARRYLVLAGLGVPLVLFLLLYGSQCLPRLPRADPSRPTLRVMTFNVSGNSDYPERAADLIAEEAADIVLIQELSPHHSYNITSRVATRYPYKLLEPLPGRRGVGILSRYPLEDGGWVKLGQDRNAAQRVVVEWQGRAIQILNVHLESTMADDEISYSFRERETQVQQLLALIREENIPTIVAGDFNLTDTTAAYAMLARELEDSHRNAGSGLGLTFPANPALPRNVVATYLVHRLALPESAVYSVVYALPMPPLPLLRIDYIFTSDELRAAYAYTTGWDGQSDHRAVVAGFQFSYLNGGQ